VAHKDLSYSTDKPIKHQYADIMQNEYILGRLMSHSLFPTGLKAYHGQTKKCYILHFYSTPILQCKRDNFNQLLDIFFNKD
jgi:hypothetical protein